ncbi:hypothetical protein TVAG_447500 [Trichomonas vaginalis G3]|uniref:Uncharacterized protein n=1 Tax=Trichomonas vaginalis (strain ATCC PRA-98 / G3) TaxID=412133 RepID=A2DS21_TRIV3|nr:protein CBG06246 family [Trichomonas vaginalis G3]EAY16791.1 hypothetical protein TVAG_447500 [Trichomonas vaginalis G3]KAI5490797.1 protein CBG06246 family [Trichomonas vaginalis G3]|eukprot:XP_001329014.1 hypothetical protein [Trichomonas vaginalis G3]
MGELFNVNISQYLSKHTDLNENANNIQGKINDNSQDSSDNLNFGDEIKEKSDQMNCNYAFQRYSSSASTTAQDSIIVSKPNSFILMDLIRSCLREDGKVLQFFEKSIYPRFIEINNTKEEQDEFSVVYDFMNFIIPTFFGKISGNIFQDKLNTDEDFSSGTEFLIARTNSEEVRNNCLAVVRTLMDFSFSEQIYDMYEVNQEFLTRKSKQFFWGSRMFLQDQAIEQIP